MENNTPPNQNWRRKKVEKGRGLLRPAGCDPSVAWDRKKLKALSNPQLGPKCCNDAVADSAAPLGLSCSPSREIATANRSSVMTW
jgi:hypothetical protein